MQEKRKERHEKAQGVTRTKAQGGVTPGVV
jgi:hypothetical protein